MHHSNGLLGRGRFGCTGAVRGGRPSPEPSFTSLQQTLTARPRSVHQAREQSLSVGECDRGVDIIPLTVWPLTFMLALKAVPHGCRHLLFTTMCSTIPTSPDSGLTSRCDWTAKANPPAPHTLHRRTGGRPCRHMLVVATRPNSFGLRRTAIQRRLRRCTYATGA